MVDNRLKLNKTCIRKGPVALDWFSADKSFLPLVPLYNLKVRLGRPPVKE